MAWNRTAASLITFGFALFNYLHQEKPPTYGEQIFGARTYGLCIMATGEFTLVIATWQHRQQLKALRLVYPEAPISLSSERPPCSQFHCPSFLCPPSFAEHWSDPVLLNPCYVPDPSNLVGGVLASRAALHLGWFDKRPPFSQFHCPSFLCPPSFAEHWSDPVLLNPCCVPDPTIQTLAGRTDQDRFPAPLQIDELNDPIGLQPSSSPHRCSDKGFLPMSVVDYVELLDWTARQVVHGKQGHTPESAPPILERLSIAADVWTALARDFGRMFYHAAGKPRTIDQCRSRVACRRFHIPRATRQVYATAAAN